MIRDGIKSISTCQTRYIGEKIKVVNFSIMLAIQQYNSQNFHLIIYVATHKMELLTLLPHNSLIIAKFNTLEGRIFVLTTNLMPIPSIFNNLDLVLNAFNQLSIRIIKEEIVIHHVIIIHANKKAYTLIIIILQFRLI